MKTLITLSLLALVPVSGTPATRCVDAVASGDFAAGAIAFGDRHEASCSGKTVGFWGNPNGKEIIESGDFLSVLPSLHLVDENGDRFTTTDYEEFAAWLQGANSVNMAYMLSAQLVAMKFNVLAGNVQGQCLIRTNAGEITIDELIDQAIDALIKDSFTPVGDPYRRRHQIIKDELDEANNNENWT